MGWVGTVTDTGQTMLAQIAGGEHTLTILKATAGTGTRNVSDLAAATALVNERGDITIVEVQRQSNSTRVWTRVQPSALAYTVKEIGIWAKVDNGASALFSIHQNSDGVQVPASTDDPNFIFDLICTFALSNTDNFSVTVDPTSLVTQADIADALRTSAQILTSSEQAQARTNIGAAAAADIAGTYPLTEQTGYTSDVTIEDFLDTLPPDESWMTTITSNASTGALVTLTGQHLFHIVQLNVGHQDSAIQIAQAINDNSVLATRVKYNSSWSSWDWRYGTRGITIGSYDTTVLSASYMRAANGIAMYYAKIKAGTSAGWHNDVVTGIPDAFKPALLVVGTRAVGDAVDANINFIASLAMAGTLSFYLSNVPIADMTVTFTYPVI